MAVRAVQYARGGMYLAALLLARLGKCTARAVLLVTLRILTRAADERPADDLSPPIPVLVARSILTAAPPASRAPVRAGAVA
jgi:hypothetical protein